MTSLLKLECMQFAVAPGRAPLYPSRTKPAPFSLNHIDCVGTKKAKMWQICWGRWIHF